MSVTTGLGGERQNDDACCVSPVRAGGDDLLLGEEFEVGGRGDQVFLKLTSPDPDRGEVALRGTAAPGASSRRRSCSCRNRRSPVRHRAPTLTRLLTRRASTPVLMRAGADRNGPCHAEGREFESHHPLEKPPLDGGFCVQDRNEARRLGGEPPIRIQAADSRPRAWLPRQSLPASAARRLPRWLPQRR